MVFLLFSQEKKQESYKKNVYKKLTKRFICCMIEIIV